MADTKITALTALTAADPANDVIPIVDISDTSMAASGTTKKISINNLLACSPSATLASATITGDLTVDTSTLKVDSTNDVVLIGSATKSLYGGNKLEVRGASISDANLGVTNTGNLAILTTDSQAIDTGGVLSLGGGFNGTTPYIFAGISGRKETSTNGIAQGYLQLFTTNVSNGIVERYRIAGDGVHTWRNVGGTSGTAMTLNASGLGVGTSPSTKLDVRGANNASQATFSGTAGRGLLISTRSDSLADDRTVILNAQFATGSLGQLVIQTAGTDRLLVDNGGNVGIGVTPSAWASDYRALQIRGVSLSNDASATDLRLSANLFVNSSGINSYIAAAAASRYRQGSGSHIWDISTNTPSVGGSITFTQAMTLDASGNLLVGKTSASVTTVGFQTLPSGEASVAMTATTGAATTLNVYSTGAAAYRFFVGLNGTISATNTTISAISDSRLKENVEDIDVGLGAILALKPRKFDWKVGKGKDIKGDRGFIAQEFEQVFPQLVDEWKDPAPEGEAPYKSVRQDLIPVLVKAIQELAAEVNALKKA